MLRILALATWATVPFLAVLWAPRPSSYAYFLAFTACLALISFVVYARRFGLPEALLVGLIFMTNSAFVDPAFLPRLPLGGGNFFLSDFYLILACILMWMSPSWKTQQLSFPYKKQFLALGGAVALSVCVAISRGAEGRYILRELHPLIYYPLTIFLVLCAIRSAKAELRLMSAIMGIVLVSALATFWQIALMDRFEFMTYATPVFDLSGAALDALRIRPPSQWLFVCFLAGSIGAYPLWRKQRTLMFAVLGLVTICLFLGYSRAYILDLATGLGMVFLVMKHDLTAALKSVIRFALVAVLVCLVIRVTVEKVAPKYWEAFEDRVVSSMTTNALQSDDPWIFGSRLYEVQSAIGHIRDHPVLGLGVGSEYRNILPFEYLQTEIRENPDDATHYMHDAYVYVWMKYGLLGVLAAIWILGHFLSRTWTLARGAISESALFVAILAAFAALLGSNLVSPSFLDPPAAPTLVGLMAGLVEVGHWRLVHEGLSPAAPASGHKAKHKIGSANPELGLST